MKKPKIEKLIEFLVKEPKFCKECDKPLDNREIVVIEEINGINTLYHPLCVQNKKEKGKTHFNLTTRLKYH